MQASSKPVATEAADRLTFLRELFSAIDRKDTDCFVSMLTPDAEFHFGNAPPVRMRRQIGAAIDNFFSTIAGLSHTLRNIVENAELVACEGKVTYTRHDGTSITLPFADVFEFDGELIAGYRIYIDIGPLYAATS